MATGKLGGGATHSTRQNLAYGTASIIIAFDLAIAAPLLSTLGQGAEFFVAHDASQFEILGTALLFVLVIPLGFSAVLAASRLLGRRMYCFSTLATLSILMAIWAMNFIKGPLTDIPGSAQIAIAMAIGATIVLIAIRWSHTRNIVPWLALAPAVFLVDFLFLSPSSKLVFRSGNIDEPHQNTITIDNPLPIFMLVFDELPIASLMTLEGTIDSANFPNFSRLADMSTWYRNASTLDDHTNWAVPALLDGIAPDRTLLPIAADHPNNLFEILSGTYRIHALEPITRLCVSESCEQNTPVPNSSDRWRTLLTDAAIIIGHSIYPESWSHYLPSITETWKNFGQSRSPLETDQVVDSDPENREILLDEIRANNKKAIQGDHVGGFEHFLEQIDISTEPVFVFNHVMLPHRPWNYLPSGQRYPFLAHPGRVKGRWGYNEWLLRQGYQRHILQVALADRLLGKFLDKLETKDLLNSALLIVVADHGVAFEFGAVERTVRKDTIGALAAIPLFIKYPRQSRPVIDDQPVTTLDLTPTVLDVLAASAPLTDFEGTSLLDPISNRTTRLISYNDEWLPVPVDGLDKYRVIERKYELLGNDGEIDFYAVAPRGLEQLLGRDLSGLTIEGPSGATTTLGEDLSFYQSVLLKQSLFPGFIDGLLKSEELSDPTALAIAINGRVSAITETFMARRPGRWHAILTPALFKEGENLVEIFQVESIEGKISLHPVQITES
jgi:hypothetical protein